MFHLKVEKGRIALPHLELRDPGAVPVGLRHQLHEELPLGSALHGWWRRGVRGGVGSRGNRDGIRRLTPSPVEDPLDTAFDRRALQDHEYKFLLFEVSSQKAGFSFFFLDLSRTDRASK